MEAGEIVSVIRDNLGQDKVQFEWVQAFADKLTLDTFIDELGLATSFAHALCGLFALFYICRIVWVSWANGSQIDIYKCLKPFAIGMSIMFFAEIAAGVDFLAGSIGKATQQFSDNCTKSSEKQFDEYIKGVTDSKMVKKDESSKNLDMESGRTVTLETNAQNKETVNVEQGWIEEGLELLRSIKNAPDIILKGISCTWWSLLQSVCVLFASIVSCCVLCMGFIGRCVFYFFGPILFAMELIPGMEGRIAGWFKKYLTFSLYPCLINIVNGVLILLMVTLTDLMAKTVGSVDSTIQADGIVLVEQAGRVHFIVAFIGAFMFMSIPSVATQIMDTASNALGGSGMIPVSFAAGKAGDQIASKIGRGAAAKATGGMSEVVNTAKNVGRQASSDSNFKG